MPKKKKRSPKKKAARPETEQAAERLLQQLLGSNPTHGELEDVLGQLLGSAGVAGVAGLAGMPLGPGFGPQQIELAEPPASVQMFTVRVDLHGAKPPIWRLLEVPGDTTLAEVHEILQLAMGWTDTHLHQFELPTGSGRPGAAFTTDLDEDPDAGTHEADVRLDQVLSAVGDKLRYEYDFGDGWEHVLAVKAIDPLQERRVRCVGGRRACPPEDCGGIWGYEEILETLRTPRGELDECNLERLDWLPPGFDPAEFDLAETDQMLQEHVALGPGVTIPPGLASVTVLPGTAPDPRMEAARALRPLLRMAPVPPPDLVKLIEEAGLEGEVPEPPDELAVRLVEPWVVLQSEVGDGLQLTAAGYLPPASVRRIFDQLALGDEWIGKGNREDQTLPVAELRSTAQALGLVRKRHRELLPTAAGRRLAGGEDVLFSRSADGGALLRHIESRLPLPASGFGEQAALLLLLFAAAGRRPAAALAPAGDTLTQLGWHADDGSVPALAVRDRASNTYAVLDRLHQAAGGSDRFGDDATPAVVRDFARRVLRD